MNIHRVVGKYSFIYMHSAPAYSVVRWLCEWVCVCIWAHRLKILKPITDSSQRQLISSNHFCMEAKKNAFNVIYLRYSRTSAAVRRSYVYNFTYLAFCYIERWLQQRNETMSLRAMNKYMDGSFCISRSRYRSRSSFRSFLSVVVFFINENWHGQQI